MKFRIEATPYNSWEVWTTEDTTGTYVTGELPICAFKDGTDSDPRHPWCLSFGGHLQRYRRKKDMLDGLAKCATPVVRTIEQNERHAKRANGVKR